MIRTLFAFLLLCSPVLAQTTTPHHCPCVEADEAEFRAAYSAAYAAWAIKQNELAYAKAAQLRDEVNGGTVGGTTISHSETYGWTGGLRRGGWNNVTTRQFNTVAPGATPFGGGPVWIINPFCPPPMTPAR